MLPLIQVGHQIINLNQATHIDLGVPGNDGDAPAVGITFASSFNLTLRGAKAKVFRDYLTDPRFHEEFVSVLRLPGREAEAAEEVSHA